MGRKTDEEIRTRILQMIKNAGRRVTVAEIAQEIYGSSDVIYTKRINNYCLLLMDENKITRIGSRPYLYSISGDGIDVHICSVCNKPVLYTQDDMCPVCFDAINQTAPSIPEGQNHLARRTKTISKISRAFNPVSIGSEPILSNTQKVVAPTPIKSNTSEIYSNGRGRLDVLQKYLDTQVKVQIKNSNTVLFGNVLRIEGGCIGLQTTRGPLDIDIDAIAVIGQWDQSVR